MAVRENRSSQRFSVKSHAELWSEDGLNILYSGRLINLSTSGLKAFFEKQPVAISKNLKVKFGLEKARPFFFDSELMWTMETEKEIYVGVKFKNLSLGDKEGVRNYLRDLRIGDRYTM
ncbi:MAG: hypothetical protein A2539_01345 [Elusimicrobia bacterium RIFOXYD2_FULL_34_15]|nr:MAG: hypothetical protein A2539_01345 [Elusimicrobia bacterium RIFOXYD2_FULL_34_15]